MKRTKKTVSILLALVMIVCSALTAFAANTNSHTITITNDEGGHIYSAYQVFKGDFYDGKLSNIDWGSGVNGSALLTELKTFSAYSGCNSAEDVANVIKTFDNDSEQIEKFSQIVSKHLATVAGTSVEGTDKYTIDVTGDGYYFIKDAGAIGDGMSATKYILQVVKDVTVEAKTDTPTIEKKIVEESGEVDANTASVGDKVYYEVTSKVPDMSNYKKYYFIVHDTMSAGLDFNDDVAIKVGDKTLVKDTDFTVSTSGKTEIKIVFKDFIQYKTVKDAAIVITYSATVNTDAVIGTSGNVNDVYLQYSNNPNVTPSGENEPGSGDGDVTGTTPRDYVITYITGIELVKVNGGGYELEGAKFELTGTKLNKVKVIRKEAEESTSGTYYKLKDGTYTKTEPTDSTKDKYVSTTTKYIFKTVEEWKLTKESVKATAVTGPDGTIKFEGLAEGTYTITEIKAPDGYNILKDPIAVVIECTEPGDIANGTEKASWSATITNTNKESVTKADGNGIIKITVVNNSGTTLPSTGGMGTYMFYIIGGIMVAVAIVLIVSKKRMEYKK